MQFEKSCGAIVYRKNNDDEIFILIIKHIKGGHWSFPKGHVEEGETEEQTAIREVKEETGIDIDIINGFKESVYYSPRKNVHKESVYFLATARHNNIVMQVEEISEIKWSELENCFNLLTYKNDINLLKKAKNKILKDNL